MGERPNVTVQVLPNTAGLNDGHNGAFLLLDFAYPADMTVLALTPDEPAEWDREVGC